eukprot:TRINITY_DN36139_c0_g1_i1.p1 TRINITY_DN36139_c0_g1~~TRINITY_DN36139_c0_g1_i1.p1  ORF type:complete len:162 (-),score=12.05 TRINITY_DN36139_c0_g1_i1:515-1000(-)
MTIAAVACSCSGCLYNAMMPGSLATKLLKTNGLPDLLPEADIAHCTVHDDGSFSIQLKHVVTPEIHGYPAHFSTEISGFVSSGRVTQLKGIKVFFMMAWLSIDTVLAGTCGERVYFYSSYIYKGIPLTAFDGLWTAPKKLIAKNPVYDLLMSKTGGTGCAA